MSETVHYRGIATKIEQPFEKSLVEVAKEILRERNIEIATYYDNAIECLCDEFGNEFFFHPKTKNLYKIEHTERDNDEEIIKAIEKEDNTIEYELKYYNGAAGFSECLEQAFDEMIYKRKQPKSGA